MCPWSLEPSGRNTRFSPAPGRCLHRNQLGFHIECAFLPCSFGCPRHFKLCFLWGNSLHNRDMEGTERNFKQFIRYNVSVASGIRFLEKQRNNKLSEEGAVISESGCSTFSPIRPRACRELSQAPHLLHLGAMARAHPGLHVRGMRGGCMLSGPGYGYNLRIGVGFFFVCFVFLFLFVCLFSFLCRLSGE